MTGLHTEGRSGEVPPPGSEARRDYLAGLSVDDLKAIAAGHGIEEDIALECWGWGAVAAGLPEDEPPPNCFACNRATAVPLWFTEHSDDVIRFRPYCWRCALVEHLNECRLWSNG